MGVQFLKWIMASRLGRWPSLAPEKHNLQAQASHRSAYRSRLYSEGARRAADLEEVNRYPLIPPKVDRATEMGMMTENVPSSFSPNVYKQIHHHMNNTSTSSSPKGFTVRIHSKTSRILQMYERMWTNSVHSVFTAAYFWSGSVWSRCVWGQPDWIAFQSRLHREWTCDLIIWIA